VFNRNPPPGPPSLEEGPAPEEPPRPELPPDLYIRDMADVEARQGAWGGMGERLSPNAYQIYQHNQRKGKGDVVLRGDSLLGDEIPDIGRVSRYGEKRRARSMLSDPGLSATEKMGADYWESVRRSDAPRKAKK